MAAPLASCAPAATGGSGISPTPHYAPAEALIFTRGGRGWETHKFSLAAQKAGRVAPSRTWPSGSLASEARRGTPFERGIPFAPSIGWLIKNVFFLSFGELLRQFPEKQAPEFARSANLQFARSANPHVSRLAARSPPQAGRQKSEGQAKRKREDSPPAFGRTAEEPPAVYLYKAAVCSRGSCRHELLWGDGLLPAPGPPQASED